MEEEEAGHDYVGDSQNDGDSDIGESLGNWCYSI